MFYYGLFMFIIPVLYKGKKLDVSNQWNEI